MPTHRPELWTNLAEIWMARYFGVLILDIWILLLKTFNISSYNETYETLTSENL